MEHRDTTMRVFYQYWIPFLLLAGCTLDCSESSFAPLSKPPAVVATDEARLIALCMSGEIRPPSALADSLAADLALIRSRFGDEYEVLRSISFRAPWRPSAILIEFDDPTAQLVLENKYTAWDSLNQVYPVARLRTEGLELCRLVGLYFEEILHSRRISELYVSLPGVTLAEPDGYIGDVPNVYPRSTEAGITYLFRNAWWDCFDGCDYSEYWYFVFENGSPILVGSWAPYRDPTNQPAWWPEATRNIHDYGQY
jgi:hypothetical protein